MASGQPLHRAAARALAAHTTTPAPLFDDASTTPCACVHECEGFVALHAWQHVLHDCAGSAAALVATLVTHLTPE